MTTQLDVLVVGSVNLDTRVAVQRLPRPGETISGSDRRVSGGGKGANQAAAAARSGASVAMIGAVGDDEDGRGQRAELERAGVDVGEIALIPEVATGAAFICVDAAGENLIVLTPGANAEAQLTTTRHRAAVVLVQNELPAALQEQAASIAAASGARLVVNAAPVPAEVPGYFRLADPLVVNEHEAAELLGRSDPAPADPAGALLAATGARSVVVTLGARGSLVATAHSTTTIAPERVVDVVDATGAGDTFVGTLAAHLARHDDLVLAARRASSAAADAVRWLGARPAPAMPTSAQR